MRQRGIAAPGICVFAGEHPVTVLGASNNSGTWNPEHTTRRPLSNRLIIHNRLSPQNMLLLNGIFKRKEMADLNLISELNAKENTKEYHVELLRQDPFNWMEKLTVQSLEAEILELKKAIYKRELQHCGC